MKRKSIVSLTISSLCLGVLSVGGAVTHAAFSTKKDLNRYTTVKHMVRFQATDTCDWWNDGSTKTAIYIFKTGEAGQFANDGAFMDYEDIKNGSGVVIGKCYFASLPPNKEGKTTIYDNIIFVRCNANATIGSWSAMSYASDGAFQTVDIPYTGQYSDFTMYNTTNGQSAGPGQSLVAGGNGNYSRGGMWSNSPSTYSYSS